MWLQQVMHTHQTGMFELGFLQKAKPATFCWRLHLRFLKSALCATGRLHFEFIDFCLFNKCNSFPCMHLQHLG